MKRRLVTPGAKPAQSVEDALREMKTANRKRSQEYRERSLAVHGLVCARCGKDFTTKDQHLLTVHHKDNNPSNNPPDGSNWENLCVYCHDAEHSRELLSDFEDGGRMGVGIEAPKATGGLGTFADLLARAGKK